MGNLLPNGQAVRSEGKSCLLWLFLWGQSVQLLVEDSGWLDLPELPFPLPFALQFEGDVVGEVGAWPPCCESVRATMGR